MFKRMTSLLMVIIMVISMLPAQALALGTDTETGIEVPETTAATVGETTAPAIGTGEPVTEAFEELLPEATAGETIPETEPEITVPETVPETEPVEILMEEAEAEKAAADVVAEGSCGDNLTWELANGALTITGTGDMWEYTHSERPSWLDYRTEIASVSLDDRITSIGSWAFCEFVDITDIELPAGITGIGAYAFAGCNALRTIEIPESVTFIGESAFEECVALDEIRFQGKVPTLEDEIFNEYVTATAYYPAYDPNWTAAAQQAFGGDITWKPVLPSGTCGKNLSWALNENGVLTISGSGAMEDYTGAEETPWYDYREHITAVVIDGSAASIGANAFNGITWLETVTIYAPISSIGNDAFAGCDNVEIRYSGTANQWRLMGCKVNVTHCTDGDLWDFGSAGDNLVYMVLNESLMIFPEEGVEGSGKMSDFTSGSAPWYWRRDKIRTITMESGVGAIGSYAFADCTLATTAAVADTVTVIGANSFSNCVLLSIVDLPDGVTTINANAFSGCTGLKHIYIPESVTTIRASSYTASPFRDCSDDLAIYCHVDTRARGWGSYWNQKEYGVLLTTTFSCDRENYNYWSTVNKNVTSLSIPEGITLIPVKAFYNCSSLQSVIIPDTVTTIHTNAFNGCYSLRHLFLPASVTTIFAAAYTQAPFNDTSMTLYCEVRNRQEKWDQYWSTGVNIQWGYSRHEYRQWCDLDLSGPVVILPQGIDSIPYRAFSYDRTVNMVIIPETVKTIGDEAFIGCSSLTDMAIPEGVETIGEQAFAHCEAMLTVSISASVKELPGSAFRGCHNILGYWVDEYSESFNCDVYGALYNKDFTTLIRVPGALEGEFEVPSSVTTIAAGAFAGCDGLQWIFIPNSVTTMGQWTMVDTGIFDSTSELLNIYCEAEKKPEGWPDDWNGNKSAFFNCTGDEIAYWDTLDRSASVITIPENVRAIPNKAFSGCTNLTDVIIHNGVTGIGIHAFEGCTGLTKLHIPESVEYVYRMPFLNCAPTLELYCTFNPPPYGDCPEGWEDGWDKYDGNVADAYLPVYNGYAARSDMLLWPTVDKTAANIVLPEGITSIPYGMFYRSGTLKSITIPDTVTKICSRAFYDCDNLHSITIPTSVTTLEMDAFAQCDNLTITYEGTTEQWMSIVDGDSMEAVCIDGMVYCWGKCGNNLTYKVVDNKLTFCGDGNMWDFNGWMGYFSQWADKITEVSLPDGLTNIGARTFSHLDKVQSIRIPDGVTMIGYNAFYCCPMLTSVVIPESVTVIRDQAFSGCSKLTSITIPKGVTSIGNYVFSGCSSLASVVIPEGVTSIGIEAFRDCSDLTNVIIPESVTKIAEGAFDGCRELTSVIIPEGITSIDYGVFRWCTKLTSITLPKQLERIGESVFCGCSSLIDITIPEGVTSLGEYAFYGCSSLTSIAIPESVTSIGDSAFSSCESLASITIPESVTTIGDYTFEYCYALEAITIPASVTSIGTDAFQRCYELKEIKFMGSAPEIAHDAFQSVSATAYYPIGDPSWTADVMQDYNGSITWKPICIGSHNPVTDAAVAPTCTEIGLTEGSHCSVCGMVLVAQEEIPTKDHTPGAAATCTTNQLCTVCKAELAPAKGHTKVIDPEVPGTCTEPGLTAGSHCSVCGVVLVAQKETFAIGHTAVADAGVAPTCTETGLTEGRHCYNCNEILVKREVIPAKGHTEVIDPEVPSTCTEPGLTAGSHCSVCGVVLIAQEETFPIGHTEVVDAGVAPTCTTSGMTEGSHCSRCKDSLVKQGYLPPLGHERGPDATCTTAQVCTRCNLEFFPAIGHDMIPDDEIPATCTESGIRSGAHCSRCDYTEGGGVIPALGHTKVVDTAVTPTCTETGLTEGKHCSVCNTVLVKQEVVAAQGHTEVVDAAVAPTCTETGLMEGKHCSVCNTVLVKQEVVAAQGHTEVVDAAVAPTCTETGLTEGKHCSVCNEVLVAQTEISALGHTEVNDAAVAPTCTETGLTEGKHCSVCNVVLVAREVVPTLPHEVVETADQTVCAVCGKEIYMRIQQSTITLDLQENKTAQIAVEVSPAELKEKLIWTVESGEGVISVDQNGKITALQVGTTYVLVSVEMGGVTLTARCRVDVAPELKVDGIRLSASAVTAELFSTDYPKLDVLLKLPQNYASAASPNADVPENRGITIEKAVFSGDTAKFFRLVLMDDRRLAIVPTDYAIQNPDEVSGSYTSAVTVTVLGEEFTSDTLKLTVKKTQPKLKGTAPAFNSFYTGQSQEITITGATVTGIALDPNKTQPEWLALEGNALVLTEKAPHANASGTVNLLVETEQWRVPVAVALSVKNTYKAPGLKLSATSVTVTKAAANSAGVALKLTPAAKADTLESLRVTGITAPDGYAVENFNVQDGTFTLKMTEDAAPGKITLGVRFDNSTACVQLTLTVKTADVKLKLAKTSITLNKAAKDSAVVDLAVTPADFRITDPSIRIMDSKGKTEMPGELNVAYADGKITVSTNEKSTGSYKVYISAGGSKEVALTVKTVELTPSVTFKAKGNLDLTFPGNAVEITPSFKNYSGSFAVVADDHSPFVVTQEGKAIRVSTEKAQVGSHSLKLRLTLADGSTVENTVKITVKRTAVKLKLSASKLSLNKQIGDKDAITVTAATKGYTLGDPVWQLMDKSGKVSAEGKLDISWTGEKLAVAVNEASEYGATYKLLVKANAEAAAQTVTVTVPAENKSAVTVTLKVKGNLDVIRDSSSMTVTATYKNCAAETDRTESIVIVNAKNEDVTNLFNVTGENGVFTVTKAPGAQLNTAEKYQIKLVADFGTTITESNRAKLTVKMGSAKVAAATDGTLFAQDKHSRINVSFASTDAALNDVVRFEIKDAKYRDLFEIYDYGNGEFAIGFKGGKVVESTKPITLNLNVFLEGNDSAKENATVKIKLTIVK